MKQLLWLDDLRDPKENMWNNWIARQGVNPAKHKITWVKNYDEFIDWILSNGLPSVVCFDHDLGEDTTMSGFDATKWMVNYCIDNNLRLPNWYIQSANPVGAENIKSYLQSFAKTINN
jgi:hypothetical protein